jgi:hypothetical protein
LAEGAHQVVRKVKDRNVFSVDDLKHYDLQLLISNYEFQMCVIDTRDQKCLLLEDYTFNELLETDALTKAIFKLFEGHHLLMAGYWNEIKVAIRNQKFHLVPREIFEKNNLPTYLQLNGNIDTDTEYITYYEHKDASTVCVFAINSAIKQRLDSIYINRQVTYIHQSSAIIEGLLHDYKHHKTDADLVLLFGRDNLIITRITNNKLEFLNRFLLVDEQDAVKYTLTVMKELGISPDRANVELRGEIYDSDSRYQSLYKYIHALSFCKKPSYLTFSFEFDELKEHAFSDLYGMYLCR